MSPDDFTDAARMEAWRRHPDPVDVETGEPVDDWGFEEQGRRDFQAGAEWARTHLTEQEPTEADKPDPSVNYYAMWWKAERDREKAERERDEARVRGGEYLIRAEKAEDMRDRWKATANSADDVIRAVRRELGAGPDTDPVLKAKAVCDARDAWREVAKQKGSEQPRPLTADDLDGEELRKRTERVQVAVLRARRECRADWARIAVFAALTPQPARPEGAEEWEDWLIETLPHESMPDEDIARLADQIATRAARRDKEDDQ